MTFKTICIFLSASVFSVLVFAQSAANNINTTQSNISDVADVFVDVLNELEKPTSKQAIGAPNNLTEPNASSILPMDQYSLPAPVKNPSSGTFLPPANIQNKSPAINQPNQQTPQHLPISQHSIELSANEIALALLNEHIHSLAETQIDHAIYTFNTQTSLVLPSTGLLANEIVSALLNERIKFLAETEIQHAINMPTSQQSMRLLANEIVSALLNGRIKFLTETEIQSAIDMPISQQSAELVDHKSMLALDETQSAITALKRENVLLQERLNNLNKQMAFLRQSFQQANALLLKRLNDLQVPEQWQQDFSKPTPTPKSLVDNTPLTPVNWPLQKLSPGQSFAAAIEKSENALSQGIKPSGIKKEPVTTIQTVNVTALNKSAQTLIDNASKALPLPALDKTLSLQANANDVVNKPVQQQVSDVASQLVQPSSEKRSVLISQMPVVKSQPVTLDIGNQQKKTVVQLVPALIQSPPTVIQPALNQKVQPYAASNTQLVEDKNHKTLENVLDVSSVLNSNAVAQNALAENAVKAEVGDMQQRNGDVTEQQQGIIEKLAHLFNDTSFVLKLGIGLAVLGLLLLILVFVPKPKSYKSKDEMQDDTDPLFSTDKAEDDEFQHNDLVADELDNEYFNSTYSQPDEIETDHLKFDQPQQIDTAGLAVPQDLGIDLEIQGNEQKVAEHEHIEPEENLYGDEEDDWYENTESAEQDEDWHIEDEKNDDPEEEDEEGGGEHEDKGDEEGWFTEDEEVSENEQDYKGLEGEETEESEDLDNDDVEDESEESFFIADEELDEEDMIKEPAPINVDDKQYDFSEQVDELDNLAIKLDLARAYFEMKDFDTAEEVLKTILHQGSISQQEEAKKLMDELNIARDK